MTSEILPVVCDGAIVSWEYQSEVTFFPIISIGKGDDQAVDLRNLQSFLSVADHLNFTRAAEALGYAQSTITGQIRALEEEIGQPLFERLGKRVALTEAGRRLRPYAAQMVSLAREAAQVSAGADSFRGALIIGAAESHCVFRLPAVLRTFRLRFPQVQLQLHAGGCTALREGLRSGEIDLALLIAAQGEEPPDLVVRNLIAERISVVAYPWHPLATARQVMPADLTGAPLIHTEAESTYRIAFDRVLAAHGVKPGPIMEFNSVEAIKQCVMAGLGIAVLPHVTCAAEFEQGSLVELDWAGPAISVATQLVYHRDKRISPAMGAFIEAVQQSLVR
ncbi:MAG: transcriptional regulator [Symbiobacteriaceae bacterium]|nr:transcriptional regulator [Symbiobacteriaceae bacterium]